MIQSLYKKLLKCQNQTKIPSPQMQPTPDLIKELRTLIEGKFANLEQRIKSVENKYPPNLIL